jgi:hypothetical protein
MCQTAFHSWADRNGEHFDQCIQRLIRLPKVFDLLYRVKNRGVMATVVESADPDRAPSRHIPGQIHRNLPAQAWGGPIPRNASTSEMIGDRGFDLFQ